MDFRPEPIDTSGVELTDDIRELTEMLAENTHNVWARERMAQGWRYGPTRDDVKKEHPGLVPYDDLPESEKDHDRNTTLETLKLIMRLGYRIERD